MTALDLKFRFSKAFLLSSGSGLTLTDSKYPSRFSETRRKHVQKAQRRDEHICLVDMNSHYSLKFDLSKKSEIFVSTARKAS